MSGALSSMSDADLQALHGQLAVPSPAPDMGTLSDTDLQALHSQLASQVVSAHPVAGPSDSMVTDIGRRLGTGAANAIAGIASLPHTVAQGVDAMGNLATLGHVPAWAVPALESVPSVVPSGAPTFPDFNTAKGEVLHAMRGTEYVPATWAGRRTQDVINGVMGGGLANAAIAGPEAALAMTPAVAGGSLTGGQAAEMFPNHPMAAAILGSIPGIAAGNAAVNLPQRVASMAGGGTASEPYGAFARLGLPTNLAGTTTGEPGLAFAEKFAARMPGSEGAVANARSNLVGGWQDKLNDIANGVGNAATPQEAGTSLQGAASNWLDQFKNEQNARWGLFHTVLPDDHPVPVPAFKSSLNGVLQDFGGADNLAKVLQPQLAANLKSALGADLNGGGTLPWQSVQSTRTALGEMLENPQPIEGISKGAVKRLYGGLSQDMGDAATAAGPTAQALFRQASDVTRTGHDILDNYVSPVLQAKTPEQATQFVMSQARQGGTRLEGVLNNLPSAAGDVRSYALRNAAGATESPTSLATALAGRKPIYSPEAQNTLFNDPAVQQQVTDLAATGRAMQPFEKDLANSPTATHQTRGLGRLMAAAELAKQGHELAGVPGAIAGGTAGLFAPNILGRVAQATALNPMMAALYGKQIPYPAQNPSLLARTIMAQGLAPRLAAPGVAVLPATSASSAPISQ